MKLFLALLCAVANCFAIDDTNVVFRVSGIKDGKKWETAVTKALTEKSPPWYPGKAPVPLSIDAAIKEALSFLHGFDGAEPPKWRITKVTLQEFSDVPLGMSKAWGYIVEASPTRVQGLPTRMNVIVLLNGDVIHPTEIKE